MVKFSACFPGQGSQKKMMAIDLYNNSKSVRELFELASDATKIDVYSLLASSDESTLQRTENTQVAITVANRSVATVLKEGGITFSSTAGFSLGELSAYAEAKVIGEKELFEIVKTRGILMAEASKNNQEVGMAAVVGIGFDKVNHLLKASGAENLYLSNDNSPYQVVIAGYSSEIERYTELLKKEGAKRVITLRVSGPFHTPYMQTSQNEFASFLEDYTFSDAQIPLYLNVTGELEKEGNKIKQSAIKQLTQAVRWTSIMQKVVEDNNVDVALEVGPGKVLNGLWKNSGQSIDCHSLESYDEIQKFIEEL